MLAYCTEKNFGRAVVSTAGIPRDRGAFRAANQQGAIGLAWARALRMGANEPQYRLTSLSEKA